MTDVTPNRPEVVSEVRALLERYEQALVDNDIAVLDATFRNSPHTIRYAFHENGYGFAEIHAHLENAVVNRGSLPGQHFCRIGGQGTISSLVSCDKHAYRHQANDDHGRHRDKFQTRNAFTGKNADEPAAFAFGGIGMINMIHYGILRGLGWLKLDLNLFQAGLCFL